MARFRASILPVNYHNRKITRLGHHSMQVCLDGWNKGIKVSGWVDGYGNDCFNIVITGGSNNPSKMFGSYDIIGKEIE